MAYTTNVKKKTNATSYEEILRSVKAGHFKPIYYLMGDESYYIDRIADYIVDVALQPDERDFNLITFFGADSNIDNIISSAKTYPMGANHLVVVVKEAQNLKNIDHLTYYLKQIQPSTILIFCHKNGSLDKRTKVATLIEKEGVLYESKKLYDNQLPQFITNYLRRKHIAAAPGVAEMMAEYVGSDLNRIASEIEKLLIALPQGEKTITIELLQQNMGITKNYNIFELQDAIGKKDILKANRIIKYFESTPKENPIQKILPALFKFFSNLMLAYYSPQKTPRGIAEWIGIQEWQVNKNILPAMSNYKGVKVMNILAEIRRTDARSKGSEGSHTSSGDLMKELIFFILH